MGKFVRNIEVEQEFDGDRVLFACKSMDKKSMLTFYAFPRERVFEADGVTPKMAEGSSKQEETLSNEALKFLVDAFAEHVTTMCGVKDAAGVELDKETVFASAYFFALTTAAATEWSSRSLQGNSSPSAK